MITVRSVFRYPVKSMLGVPVEAASAVPGGLVGDRGWALVDGQTGRVASAKRPRLWRRLLEVGVDQPEEGGRILMTLPDGTRLNPGTPEADEALSRFLDRPVSMRQSRDPGAEIDRSVPEEVLEQGMDADVDATVLELSAESPGPGFQDYAPLHVITTATLAALEASVGRPVDPRVLRPNLVLDTPGLDGYAENDWIGSRITIGERVRLEVFQPTPRCAVPTLPHGDTPADPDVLRALSKDNRVPLEGSGPQPVAGVYLKVLTGGTIHAGDPVRLDPRP
jgi:uncharacterized protein YcbX